MNIHIAVLEQRLAGHTKLLTGTCRQLIRQYACQQENDCVNRLSPYYVTSGLT